ncbi:Valacyclovir hydrolase [Gryllus bimaculatus]|nr:Valacyclovir hydrolase [Gryllus bimaculatus]
MLSSMHPNGLVCVTFRSLSKIARNLHYSRRRKNTINPEPVEEKKIDIEGIDINYVQVGTGPHHILLTPGALGSIWTDFKPQIDHLNKSKFTLVAWDPPGYGKSRPPKRSFSPGFYYRDADFGVKLMEKLGIGNYSLLGWNNGGTSSIIMAAKQPSKVMNLVVWGSYTYITENEAITLKGFRDHTLIPPRLKNPYIDLYGEEHYDELWTKWIDATIAGYNSETKGDICTHLLPNIICPTLILHGWKDINISMEHYQFLANSIQNAKFFTFEEGKHYLHLQFWKEFNRIIEYFLLKE